MTIAITETELLVGAVRSLCWSGDTLVDWVAGGKVFDLDGTVRGPFVNWSYRFDAAVVSPSGTYAAIFERFGTKALLVSGSTVVRELNRSYYCADSYEYPIALFRTSTGVERVVHCPDEYWRLEVDDLKTGRRLTSSEDRKLRDVFHSRLTVSRDGRYLASAGWIWHPVATVELYDLDEAILTPPCLDGASFSPDANRELSSAAWVDESHLAIGLSDEIFESSSPPLDFAGHGVAIYDVHTRNYRSAIALSTPVGELMPVGSTHIASFYGWPKLIELATGRVIQEWPMLKTKATTGPYSFGAENAYSFAADSVNNRFAVAHEAGITIVRVQLEAQSIKCTG
jgi:hypothetical protein